MKMDVPVAVDDDPKSHNVIAVHLDIRAPDPASIIVTGSTTNSIKMPRSGYLSKISVNNGGRTRSASAGRDKKSDLRAKYWAFLFENLQLVVDELYQTCETDENVSECKEVILILENYTRDFHNLAEWFRVKWEYEHTPPPQRPNSLAWEIRKSSPGKIFRKSCQPKLDSAACRELNFELNKTTKPLISESIDGVLNTSAPHTNAPLGENPLDAEIPPLCVPTSQLRILDSKPASVDCGCQTEDEIQTKKTIQIGRKVVGRSSPYVKKMTRNFSISTAPDRNATIPLQLPIKRLSGSPRKPVSEWNIAAPVFVPSKKILNTQPKLVEAKTLPENTKVPISRSQSDSVFERSAGSPKAELKEKHYASVECVKSERSKDDSCSKLGSVTSMEVINEGESASSAEVSGEPERTNVNAKCGETVSNRGLESRDSGNELCIKIVNVPFVEGAEITDTSSKSQISNTAEVVSESIAIVSCNQSSIAKIPQTTSEPVAVTQNSVAKSTHSVPKSNNTTNAITPQSINIGNAAEMQTRVKMQTPEKPTIVEMTKKTEVKRVPCKTNLAYRPRGRQWDPKPQRPNVAERKTNATSRAPSARVVNQKYMTNVGVPKVSNNDKLEKSNPQPAVVANQTVSDLKSPKPAVQKTTEVNYSTVTTSNKEAVLADQSVKCPNMVRSKTSIDIKSRAQVLAPNSAPNQIVKQGRELPPRSRRSSKDSDGWEMVISRSRRSIPSSLSAKDRLRAFDINKRFYEPSPSTSLPTLSTVGVKQKSPDSTKVDKDKNRNRNNSQSSNQSKENGNNIRLEYDKYKLNKERPIISSTAMFTTISSKRKKSNEKDARRAKPTKENKRKSSKESDKQANANFTDEESLRKSKELHEEEISLQKEINDLQNADPETDVDADSDCTEVDPEIAELCLDKTRDHLDRRAVLEDKYNHILTKMTWSDRMETLDKLEELLDRDPSGKSLQFAKNFTSLKQFEDLVARWPGRALELHQKLSSPSRKRDSPDNTILQHKARQAKAKMNREQLLQDKSAKIRELFNKVAEVKAMQMTLAEERRKSLDQKLRRAEENRNLHLKNIQEKAHDEAKKQKEIAFINELEAQNKRHDFYALCQEQEDRLQSILGERQRRQEEKAAKDAAVEERRKAIEAERQEKIEELQQKMRKREERIDREFQEKERERIKMAREKARDREDRLLALQAAQIANAEELQKKIQQKQENSARRHEESIELIRQRAIEIGTPRLTPYQINKLCSLCNVVIDSEVFLLSHLRGPSHQEAVKKYREQFEASVKFSECSIITDAPADVLHEKKSREKERQKTLRKRCKKIRQRLVSRSEKYLKNMNEKDQTKKIDTPTKRRIFKSIKEIEKLINSQGNGIWPNNVVTMLERNLFEIIRVLEKGDKDNQQMFREFDGFTMISRIYNLALDLPKNMSPYLPLKCFVVVSYLYTNACNNNVDNCLHVLLSNHIVQILEFLLNRLNLIMPNSDDRNGMVVYKADTVADVLMNLCSIVLSNITPLTMTDNEQKTCSSAEIAQHLQDVVSYIVCTGIVDKLAVYCSSVHDNKSADSYFLLHSIELLTQLVETRKGKISEKEDCTQLMATLKATELVGAVSMLYAMLLHQDSMSNDAQTSMGVLQQDVVNVIIATMRLFSKVGELNLVFFQNILGAEGISLQVRHIISYLLKYCVQNDGSKDLLHQVIEFIGFFAIHHHDNQMIIQSGSTPTVLQQLSSLPFSYFNNPNLVRILFPTLLACCVNNAQNRMILDQEMSYQLLEDFKNSDESKDIPLMKLLR